MAGTTADSTRSLRPPAGDVELLLSQIESLPTLPAVAGRLLEMTLDNRFGSGDVAALVESDQSLSARILSLVRKASVGSDVQTVQRAVVLLGCDVVRSLVLGVQIFDLFSHRAQEADGRFDRVGFWRHSLAVGCAARLIAEKRLAGLTQASAAKAGWPLARPEEAFVCGLLHDLGKVVFDACFPKSYGRVVERVEATRANIADVERDIFGLDHAVAGHRLAQHWRLPQVIAECVWLHHASPETTPGRLGYPDHVLLIQAADRLVRQMGIGYSGNHSADAWSQPLNGRLGLQDKALTEIMAELPEAIELRAELLGLREITSREVLQETIARTNSELARLNTELILANRALQQRSRTLDALAELNRGLGTDNRHETVVAALIHAVRQLVASAGVAAYVVSPARHVVVLGLQPADGGLQMEVLPTATLGSLDSLRRESGSIDMTLPGCLLDRLGRLAAPAPGASTGSPLELPMRHWPLSCSGQLLAGLVTIAAGSAELDEPLKIVGSWATSWFAAAESSFVSRDLAEELVEINRKFVGSQAEVARMRSLAMVGEMAAGAAHEINNPLAVISGRAQILSRGRSADDDVRRSADIVMEHAHRASAIVTELMEFAKPDPPKPTNWPAQPFFEDVRRSWIEKKAILPEHFVLELSDDLPPIHADASQIRVLCDELIRNAVQAMSDSPGPRLVVNCRSDVADDRIVIRVEDNGCGMTPDVAEHAFDPFFSHRPAGRGRGLGLSRAARYAEINGGRIRLSSRVKEGTAVIVELPVAVEV